MRKPQRAILVLTALFLLLLPAVATSLAQQTQEVRIDSPIRGIQIDQARAHADLEVNLANNTGARQIVEFIVDGAPEGWDIDIWSPFFDYRVNELVVDPTPPDAEVSQGVALRIRPMGAAPGEYSFTLRLASADGGVEHDAATFSVSILEGEEEVATDVDVRVGIPTLEGPPGGVLGFEIAAVNNTEEEASFNLASQAPPGWEVTFLEAFGEQRAIGAINVGEQIAERVRVDVVVPMDAQLGAYEIPVTITSEQGSASAVLTAMITGQGELRFTVPQGAMPAFETDAGGQGGSNVLLVNPGSADLTGVVLSAEAPEDWEVVFDHPNNTISSLPAAHEVEVPVFVTPSRNAAPGDYIVSIQAAEGQANAVIDLRVTVTESSVWGWLGLGLVVLIMGGMIGLFLKLGRR